MPKIFISYRREDSKHAVGRLHSALKRHVHNPKQDIFIDIDNIPNGVDFVEHLDLQVAQCDAMLVVIGPAWISIRDTRTGERRLDDPNDFVRIEVASALKRGIPVVPVVLDDTGIPSAAELPEELKLLARRNGERLQHESFDSDVERLIRNLPGSKPAPAPTPRAAAPTPAPRAAALPSQRGATWNGASWLGPVVAIGLLAIGGGFAWFGNLGDWRGLGAQPASTSSRSAGETFSDCSDCPQMVAIPAGSFMMGSPASEAGRFDNEGPQRRMTVPAFAAGKYEVTWAEWDRCVAAGACASLASDGFGGGSRPVTNVSWNEAVAYAKWLSSKTGQTYRLLSEAEWEYAARAGTSSAYWWGGSASHEYANYGKDTCCGGLASGSDKWVNTSPAGSFPANNFGLHDMLGNVWEWVQDCSADNYSAGQPSNGQPYQGGSCSNRVVRGGSWDINPQLLRSAYRNGDVPSNWYYILGFRVARTL